MVVRFTIHCPFKFKSLPLLKTFHQQMTDGLNMFYRKYFQVNFFLFGRRGVLCSNSYIGVSGKKVVNFIRFSLIGGKWGGGVEFHHLFEIRMFRQ